MGWVKTNEISCNLTRSLCCGSGIQLDTQPIKNVLGAQYSWSFEGVVAREPPQVPFSAPDCFSLAVICLFGGHFAVMTLERNQIRFKLETDTR